MAQSQQTLAVYKNTKGNNYRSYKIKDFKGKKPIVKGVEAKPKILTEEDI